MHASVYVVYVNVHTHTDTQTHTYAESCVHEVLASSCHIEAAEEREAFLRALLEEHAEAADAWRELIQWNYGWTRVLGWLRYRSLSKQKSDWC